MKTVPLRPCLVLFAWLTSLSVGLFAQTSPLPAKTTDLGFLTGHWTGTASFGGSVEAFWSAPEGNNLLGSMRMMTEGKATMYEILVVEQTGPNVTLRVKHFNPGLTGREEKDAFDQYAVVELGKERVLLEKIGGDPLRVVWEKRPGSVLAVARATRADGQWKWSDLFVFKPAR